MKIEGGNINKCAAMGNYARLKMKTNKVEKKAAKICIHMGLQSAAGGHFCKLHTHTHTHTDIYIYIYNTQSFRDVRYAVYCYFSTNGLRTTLQQRKWSFAIRNFESHVREESHTFYFHYRHRIVLCVCVCVFYLTTLEISKIIAVSMWMKETRMWSTGGMIPSLKKNRYVEGKPILVALCPKQILHGMARN